jgi:hypothetical protein
VQTAAAGVGLFWLQNHPVGLTVPQQTVLANGEYDGC